MMWDVQDGSGLITFEWASPADVGGFRHWFFTFERTKIGKQIHTDFIILGFWYFSNLSVKDNTSVEGPLQK
jgi:hypothetical protein